MWGRFRLAYLNILAFLMSSAIFSSFLGLKLAKIQRRSFLMLSRLDYAIISVTDLKTVYSALLVTHTNMEGFGTEINRNHHHPPTSVKV